MGLNAIPFLPLYLFDLAPAPLPVGRTVAQIFT